MNEFANVLSELIERGKQEGELTIKKIAQHSGITASYISNLKQGNQSPPSQKKLAQLTDALRTLGVADRDIQRLVSAYHRMQSGEQHNANILGSLIDEAKKDGGKLFERIARGIRIDTQEQQPLPQTPSALDDEPLVELIKGDRRASIEAAIRFIERALSSELEGRNIYLTWFQYTHDDELEPVREQLRILLRQVLRKNSSTHLYHLWAGDATRDTSAIVTVLTHYLGTSNCYLHEVPYGQFIPEYFVIEGFGFVEARPASPDSWWIRTVIVTRNGLAQANELQAVCEYMEFLLGTKELRKLPLIQTEASRKRFAITSAEKKLTEAEKQSTTGELLLMKPGFSARHRSCETLRLKLDALELPLDSIELYLKNHQERIGALRELIVHGTARAIHKRQFFSQKLSMLCVSDTAEPPQKIQARQIEITLMKEQILGVLQVIKENPNIHVALTDDDFPIHCEIVGNTAFLAFDAVEPQNELPLERDESGGMAWTHHPDVVFQLRKEFDSKWQAIDELWRTDNEAGRKNVVNFLIAESLKPLLKADVPTEELWAFMYQLTESAIYLNLEEFRRELYTYEQVAKEILNIADNFSLITMPIDIGPWNPRSSIRTRQRVLYSILREIDNLHLVSTQIGVEQYWKTNLYRGHQFEERWTKQHFQHIHDLLLESPKKITMEIIPLVEPIRINVEIVDREMVFIVKSKGDEGGLVLQDKELAEALLSYVERNLSAKCPEHLKGARNVAKWIEERFLKSRQP